MCRYLAGEVIVIRYQHIAGCQSLYSYILTHSHILYIIIVIVMNNNIIIILNILYIRIIYIYIYNII